jgi:hypothetical protein
MSQQHTNDMIDGLVRTAELLKLSQLEELINRLKALRQQRLLKRLPGDEAELIDRINNWLPPDIQEQLSALIAVRDAGTLPADQENELTALLDKAKEAHNQRVQVLTELAGLRNISLTALMNELGVRFPDYI